MSRSLMVIAGEVSGDMHAAAVVRAMKDRAPDLAVWGIGGDELRKSGVEILHGVNEMAVMGLPEVLAKYSFFKGVYDEILREVDKRKPDAALLVDYPGFNLRIAEALHQRGIKVIYYVCPQVWAWHRSRIPRMARIIDRLIVIFPFEVDVFKGTGLKADFVGHPLVDEIAKFKQEPLDQLPFEGTRRIALLPGSREQEIRRILPAMWKAATLLCQTENNVSFLIAAQSSASAEVITDVIAQEDFTPERIEIVTGKTRQVLRQSRAAFVTSGTATVEATCLDCPMTIVYKTAWLTYTLGRLLVKVPYIGMVNLLAGKLLCPELLQNEATPQALAESIRPLLSDTPAYHTMINGLNEVAASLGQPGAAARAAEIVCSSLGT